MAATGSGSETVYTPGGGWCISLVHIIFRFPILIIALGLSATIIFLAPSISHHSASVAIEAKLADLSRDTHLQTLAKEAPRYYQAMKKVGLLNISCARLNKQLGVFPCCVCNANNIPTDKNSCHYIFFLDLIHRFGSLDAAVTAYERNSISITHPWDSEGAIPENSFLEKVKKALQD